MNIAKWWRWIEQKGDRALVLVQIFDDRAADTTKVRRGEWMGHRVATIVGERFVYVPVEAIAQVSIPSDPAVIEALAPAGAAIRRLENARPPGQPSKPVPPASA